MKKISLIVATAALSLLPHTVQAAAPAAHPAWGDDAAFRAHVLGRLDAHTTPEASAAHHTRGHLASILPGTKADHVKSMKPLDYMQFLRSTGHTTAEWDFAMGHWIATGASWGISDTNFAKGLALDQMLEALINAGRGQLHISRKSSGDARTALWNSLNTVSNLYGQKTYGTAQKLNINDEHVLISVLTSQIGAWAKYVEDGHEDVDDATLATWIQDTLKTSSGLAPEVIKAKFDIVYDKLMNKIGEMDVKYWNKKLTPFLHVPSLREYAQNEFLGGTVPTTTPARPPAPAAVARPAPAPAAEGSLFVNHGPGAAARARAALLAGARPAAELGIQSGAAKKKIVTDAMAIAGVGSKGANSLEVANERGGASGPDQEMVVEGAKDLASGAANYDLKNLTAMIKLAELSGPAGRAAMAKMKETLSKRLDTGADISTLHDEAYVAALKEMLNSPFVRERAANAAFRPQAHAYYKAAKDYIETVVANKDYMGTISKIRTSDTAVKFEGRDVYPTLSSKYQLLFHRTMKGTRAPSYELYSFMDTIEGLVDIVKAHVKVGPGVDSPALNALAILYNSDRADDRIERGNPVTTPAKIHIESGLSDPAYAAVLARVKQLAPRYRAH